MTTLQFDHSEGLVENVRAFVTEFLEHPSRADTIGVPKAEAIPVTLKVTVRETEGFAPYATVLNHGHSVHHRIARAIFDDARVSLRHSIIDAGLTTEHCASDRQPEVELLPWVGA